MLLAFAAAAVVYFAQGAPDAGSAVTIKPIVREAAPAAASTPGLTSVTQVAPSEGRTVSPLTVTPMPVAPQPKTEIAKNTVVCHNEPVLGSMFPKKICATQGQLEERKTEDQAQVRQWQALRPYKAN